MIGKAGVLYQKKGGRIEECEMVNEEWFLGR
jgi:hypothetical protein